MAQGPTIKVTGADRVADTLGRLKVDLEELAPDGVGTYVTDQARAAAPFVTGALRASLHSDTEPGVVSVGSDLAYAGVIHNGWAEHNIKANPFLVPVAEATAPIWGRIYLTETSRAAARVRGA